jgi:hypothetical protein
VAKEFNSCKFSDINSLAVLVIAANLFFSAVVIKLLLFLKGQLLTSDGKITTLVV